MKVQLAGCVITDRGGKLWLLHRNKKGVTQWELPGGKVEPNESADVAAVRELKEELGVDVRIIRSLGGDEFTENDIRFVYSWYLADVVNGELSICEPETFDDLRAFSLDEMSNLELSGNMKRLYKKAHGLGKTFDTL
jgi:8-oxo-dGTP diphosphatase